MNSHPSPSGPGRFGPLPWVRSRLTHILLALILAYVLGRGIYLTFSVPLFETADELFHFDYVYRLYKGEGFINIDRDPITEEVFQAAKQVNYWKKEGYATPEERGKLTPELLKSITWWFQWDISGGSSYEGIQPPLYYALSAGVLKMVPGVNIITQAHIARLVSLALALALVWATYIFAWRMSQNRVVALGGAALLATLPAQSLQSIRISNDILGQLWVTLLLVGLTFRGKAARSSLWKDVLFLGLPLGMAGLSKSTSLFVGLALVLAYYLFLFPGSWGEKAKRWAVVSAVGLLLSGGWYFRNYQLYGDWLGANALVRAIYVEMPWRAQNWGQALAYNSDMAKQLIFYPYLQYYPRWQYWLPLNLWVLSLVFMLTTIALDSGARKIPYVRRSAALFLLASYAITFGALRHFGQIGAILAPVLIFFLAANDLPWKNLSRLTILFVAGVIPALGGSLLFTLSTGPSSERYVLVIAPLLTVYWAYSIEMVIAPRWRLPLLALLVLVLAVTDAVHTENMLAALAARLAS